MPFINIKQSFTEWQERLNTLADHSGLHSILIMESKPDTMEVVVANEQPIYNVGDCGPKSRQPGCHELYCERVVDTAQPVFIPDASIDDEWKVKVFGKKYSLNSKIKGEFQLYNTLCSIGLAIACELPIDNVMNTIRKLKQQRDVLN